MGKQSRLTLRELLKQMPAGRWANGQGYLGTSTELLGGKGNIRLTRHVEWDGIQVFAGRSGRKTRWPLLRLVVDDGE
jgi:hypothetical protein